MGPRQTVGGCAGPRLGRPLGPAATADWAGSKPGVNTARRTLPLTLSRRTAPGAVVALHGRPCGRFNHCPASMAAAWGPVLWVEWHVRWVRTERGGCKKGPTTNTPQGRRSTRRGAQRPTRPRGGPAAARRGGNRSRDPFGGARGGLGFAQHLFGPSRRETSVLSIEPACMSWSWDWQQRRTPGRAAAEPRATASGAPAP